MEMSQPEGTSPRTQLMKAVADPVRLHVLERVGTRPGQVSVDSLAATLTTEFVDGDPTERDYSRFRVMLVHNHLPRLADLELVRYDAESETVDDGDAFTSVTGLRKAWDQFLSDVEGTDGPN